MRNSIRLTVVSAALCFGLGAGAANAGIFDGQTVNYQYFFPDLTSPYSNAANGDYFVDSNAEINNIADGYGTLDFGGDGFVVNFTSGTSWNPGAFNGFVVSDALSTMVPFTSFRLVSNTGVDGTPVLSFDADHLYVNWENLGFGGGELVFTVSPVPEPETYAMLLAGLGLLGYMTRHKKIQKSKEP